MRPQIQSGKSGRTGPKPAFAPLSLLLLALIALSLLLLIPSQQARAAVSPPSDQTTGSSGGTSNTPTCAYGTNPTQSAMLVVAFYVSPSSITVGNPTDSLGNAFTQIASTTGGSAVTFAVYVYAAQETAASAADTITLQFTGTVTESYLTCFQVVGAAAVSATTQTGAGLFANNVKTGTLSIASLTPTANDLVYVFAGFQPCGTSSASPTYTTGFTHMAAHGTDFASSTACKTGGGANNYHVNALDEYEIPGSATATTASITTGNWASNTGSATWGWAEVGVDFEAQVTQPVTYAVSPSGAPTGSPTFAGTGCAVSPTTVAGDGTSHSIFVARGCGSITATAPTGGASQRWVFNNAGSPSATETFSPTSCGSGTCAAHSVTYFDQLSNTYRITANAQAAFDASQTFALTGTFLGTGSSTICTMVPASNATDSCVAWADYDTAVSFPANPTGTCTNCRWQVGATSSHSDTTGGNVDNVNYYKQLQNSYTASPKLGSGATTWDASGTITLTGTVEGVSGSTVCNISATAGTGAASCSNVWADYNAPVSFGALAISSTEQWVASSSTASFTDTAGGATHTSDYSRQWQVHFAPSDPAAGSTSPSTTCFYNDTSTLAISASASLGYTFSHWTSSTGSITITASGSNSTTATIGAAGTITAVFGITETVTITPNESYSSSDSVTISGCNPTVSTVAMDGNPHSFGVDASCSITFTLPSDGTNTRYRFNDGSNNQVTTWSYTTGSASETESTVVFYQLYNTFEVDAQAQASFDTSPAMTWAIHSVVVGHLTTVCTITATSAASDTCSGWSDYHEELDFPQTSSAAPANSQWGSGGQASFIITSHSSSNYQVSYYKQWLNEFEYSVTGGGTPSAPTLSCVQDGAAGTFLLTTSSQPFYCDSGTTATATDPTTDSTGTERWSDNAQSFSITSGGATKTFAYYHQYLPTLGIVALAKTTFDASLTMTPTGTVFGSAGTSFCTINSGPSPGHTATCHTSWIDSGSSVTFGATLGGSVPGGTRWENGAGSSSTVTITSAGEYDVNYYDQVQDTYTASPRLGSGSTTWDSTQTNGITVSGTSLGSPATMCQISTTSGGGDASCDNGWSDYNTAIAFSALTISSTERWEPSATTGTHVQTIEMGDHHTADYSRQWQVQFAVDPSGSGGTTPSATAFYNDTSSVSVLATASSSYQFFQWSASSGSITFASATSSSTSATIGAAGTITAGFRIPTLGVAPDTGGAGAVTTLTGSQYSASTAYGYCLSSSSSSVSCISGSSGTFTSTAGGAIPASTTLTVPGGTAAGAYYVVAYSGTTVVASAAFGVSAITLTPATGGVGSVVRVSGAGMAGSTTAYIRWDGPGATPQETSPTPLTTTSGGAFAVTFTTPAGVAGAHTVYATDGANSPSATFTIVPSFVFSASAGGVSGATITIVGAGFGGSVAVTATFGGSPLTLSGTTTTGSDGGFTVNFTVPSVAAAAYTITVTDTAGNSASGTFSVVSGSAPSTTSVSCDPSSVVGGASTVCTATITGSSPSGRVTFSSSTGSFSPTSTCAVVTSGSAAGTCYVVYLAQSASGTSSITASYSGDQTNLPSHATGTVTVTSVSSVSVGLSCASPVKMGESQACTASVTASASPAGAVAFSLSNSNAILSIAQCTLSSGSCSVNVLGAVTGSVTVTASFVGQSATATVTVSAPDANSVSQAASVGTISAAAGTGGSAKLTGFGGLCSSVSLNNTGAPAGTQVGATCEQLNAPNVGVSTPTILTGGVSAPSYYDVHVGGVGAGTATVCVPDAGAATGSKMQYYAQPSGPWTDVANLRVVANTVCGDVPVSQLTGTNFVVVNPSAPGGGGGVLISTSVSFTCPSQTVTIGRTMTCTVTVMSSSGAPTGTVSFTSSPPSSALGLLSGCSLAAGSSTSASCSTMIGPGPGSVGSYTVTASYGGDSTHGTSSGAVSLTVQDPTSTTIVCSPSSVWVGSSTTCTVTVMDPLTPSSTPTAFVLLSGPASLGPGASSSCNLNDSGACSIILTPSSAGTFTVDGQYIGDTNHAPSKGSVTVTVNAIITTTTTTSTTTSTTSSTTTTSTTSTTTSTTSSTTSTTTTSTSSSTTSTTSTTTTSTSTTAPAPAFAIAPTSGPSGTTLTLSGSGLKPNTAYSYCFEPGATPSSVTACPPGSRSFTADPSGNVPLGVTLTATGESGAVVVSDSATGAVAEAAQFGAPESAYFLLPVAAVAVVVTVGILFLVAWRRRHG